MTDLSDFWASRAEGGASRWTPREMLQYELTFLRELVGGNSAGILDLGSGDGLISRTLAEESDLPLVAVDSTAEFSRYFAAVHAALFVPKSVSEFSTAGRFSLVMMFGVANFLDDYAERDLYARIVNWMAPNAHFVLKHQCSLGEEFVVDAYSTKLERHWVARYPSVAQQLILLSEYFPVISVRPYPKNFQEHSNSHHFAFVCGQS